MGRLEADLLLSQQRTESRRASSRGGEQTERFELSASSYDACATLPRGLLPHSV